MKETKKNIKSNKIDRHTSILKLKQELDILGDISDRWMTPGGPAMEEILSVIAKKISQIYELMNSGQKEF